MSSAAAGVAATGVPIGGSRATTTTSDRHTARLPIRRIGELIESALEWCGIAEVLGPRRLPHYGSPAAGAAAGKMGSMIGRMHHVVVDCPDPAAVAGFYSALLGLPVTYRDDDCVVVAASDMSSGLGFQRAPGNLPPTWPGPEVPQQVHLDIMVEDGAAAGARVLTLGAVKLDGENVYADPAGYPFCLIRRPRWAPPIPDDA
jgi:catechol 2,3-dioxygenase-like lactoylglutathione lyase family enzyme